MHNLLIYDFLLIWHTNCKLDDDSLSGIIYRPTAAAKGRPGI